MRPMLRPVVSLLLALLILLSLSACGQKQADSPGMPDKPVVLGPRESDRDMQPEPEPAQDQKPEPEANPEPFFSMTAYQEEYLSDIVDMGDGLLLAVANTWNPQTGDTAILSVLDAARDQLVNRCELPYYVNLTQDRISGDIVLFDAERETLLVLDRELRTRKKIACNQFGHADFGGTRYYYTERERLMCFDLESGLRSEIEIKNSIRVDSVERALEDSLILNLYYDTASYRTAQGKLDLATGTVTVFARDAMWLSVNGDSYTVCLRDSEANPYYQFGSVDGSNARNWMGLNDAADWTQTITVCYPMIGTDYLFGWVQPIDVLTYEPNSDGEPITDGETQHDDIQTEPSPQMTDDLQESMRFCIVAAGKTPRVLSLTDRGLKRIACYCAMPELGFLIIGGHTDTGSYLCVLDPDRLDMQQTETTAAEEPAVESEPMLGLNDPLETTAVPAELTELRNRADKIEQTYGVRIYFANQCEPLQELADPAFTRTDEMAYGQEQYVSEALDALETSLGEYPEGFFRQFTDREYNGIRFFLVGSIESSNDTVAYEYDIHGWSNIISACTNYDQLGTFFHEIWHAIENRISDVDDLAFSEENWARFNPEGFAYLNDYENYNSAESTWTYFGNWDYDKMYFVDNYSLVDPKEDRARIMENAMQDTWTSEDMMHSEHLLKKLEYMSLRLREAFTIDPQETPIWERWFRSAQTGG